MGRAGRLIRWAANAHAQCAKATRVSLPPKPPPSRFTLATTLLSGRPHALATLFCRFSSACAEARTRNLSWNLGVISGDLA